MRRIILITVIITVIIALCLSVYWGLPSVPKVAAPDTKVNQYNINCYFDAREKLLKGYEHFIYVNKSNVFLEDIYMHLYPNAFEREESAPFEPLEQSSAYPEGFDIGFLNIDNLQIEGREGNWEYGDSGRQILKVKLDKPIGPGETVDMDIHFTVKFPHCYGRFGYGKDTIKAANWYPIAAVYDHKGWNLDPYSAIGDPFYSDIADYRVTLVIAKDYTVAATGENLKKRKYDAKNNEWHFQGENVRDFVWVAADSFIISSKKSDGIRVKSYYFDKPAGKKALGFAADAISIFNRCFGKYPYRTFSVVAADFFIGGMEYPNLVLVSKELYNIERLFTLEYITVHETAHQWWYGIVGSNQVDEAWLDEGLTEYSTILYFEKKYGPDTAKGLFENLIKKRYENYVAAAEGRQNIKIHEPLEQYQDAGQYHTLVYCGGALIFQRLRDILGDEDFFEILRTYYDNYAFRNATTDDFIEVAERVSGRSLEAQIRGWLNMDV